MDSKQEAKELVERFKDLVLIDYRYDEEPFLEYQKECAVICIEGRLEELRMAEKLTSNKMRNRERYLKNVIKEIDKI